jgi:hypothetical protein
MGSWLSGGFRAARRGRSRVWGWVVRVGTGSGGGPGGIGSLFSLALCLALIALLSRFLSLRITECSRAASRCVKLFASTFSQLTLSSS